MKEALDKARVAYISKVWDVNKNCARAYILSEMGYSNSGIANLLDMTSGTIDRYQDTMESKLGKSAWFPISPSKPKYDTFPNRNL